MTVIIPLDAERGQVKQLMVAGGSERVNGVLAVEFVFSGKSYPVNLTKETARKIVSVLRPWADTPDKA